MSELDNVAPRGIVDLSDAPAGLDAASFDSLFPAEPSTQATPVAAPQSAPTQSQGTPAAPPPDASQAPFIKGDRSVYNTAEAAIQGINQKDALIEQLRQRYALTTGIDPITGQAVGQPTAPQPPADDYFANPSRYMDDLYAAAKQGGPEAYRDVQAKFLLDTLKPLQPVLQRAAREQAVQTVSKDIKDFAVFAQSPAFQAALDANPELKQAVNTAETDHRWHARLPGLYKIAYLTGQGMQLPDLLKAQATVVQSQSQNQSARPHPISQPSTPALPQQTARPSFKTIEGINATIAEAESRGVKLEF